ncbi:hypothetical protein GCWU000323_00595 [Leptotrichia hofstadii F0254]|uniref:Uncharacterized protein n=1 Tax=Leptotrichia hofstadii F0254 TaxID=634994 RepID=C9MVC4_9FUSO|nr:hypothetical protein GCWU000323_00595 [Leptotrichia hofstadii F0254]
MEYFQELMSWGAKRIDLIEIVFYKKKFKMVRERVRQIVRIFVEE